MNEQVLYGAFRGVCRIHAVAKDMKCNELL